MNKQERREREAGARALDYLRGGDPTARYGFPRESLARFANGLLGTKRQRKVRRRGLASGASAPEAYRSGTPCHTKSGGGK